MGCPWVPDTDIHRSRNQISAIGISSSHHSLAGLPASGLTGGLTGNLSGWAVAGFGGSPSAVQPALDNRTHDTGFDRR